MVRKNDDLKRKFSLQKEANKIQIKYKLMTLPENKNLICQSKKSLESEKMLKIANKPLHGKFFKHLEGAHINKKLGVVTPVAYELTVATCASDSLLAWNFIFNFSLFEPHAWRIIIIVGRTYIGQHRDRVGSSSSSSRLSPQYRLIVLLCFCFFSLNKDFLYVRVPPSNI